MRCLAGKTIRDQPTDTMKFRADLKDLPAMVQMLQSLEKFGTQCYVLLSEDSVEFIITE